MAIQFKKLKMYWEKLAARERVIVIIATSAVVLMLWSEFLYRPNSIKAQLIEKKITQTNQKIVEQTAKMRGLQATLKKDPDADNKRLLAEYRLEAKALDATLEQASIQIISTQEMTALLRQMLEQQPGLKFVSLENSPAEADFIDEVSQQTEPGAAITVYRHGVTLVVEGSYHDALAYLTTLEDLPWRFFWQAIKLETLEYPTALITLKVYTLGFRKGLVGV